MYLIHVIIFINKNLQTNIYLFHRFSCMLSEKFIMASVRKRKGMKTYLMMGKKVPNIGKYRKD